MYRPIAILALTLLSVSASAQKKTADPKPYAATITENDLKSMLYVIAGAEMEGRETATAGQRKAAEYIEQRFKSYGLKPGFGDSYQMPFPVYRDSILGSRMEVAGKPVSLNTDFQPIVQMNATATQYFSEVVFVGHGIVDSSYDDYAGVDVRGKAVLMLEGGPSSYKPRQAGMMSPTGTFAKIRNAERKGAAAVLLYGSGFPRRPMAGNGNMYTRLFKPTQSPNVYLISDEAASRLADGAWKEWKEKGRKEQLGARTIRRDVMLDFQKRTETMTSTNVLGVLEGSDKKDEWLVVTAHYDHLGKRGNTIYYGADDDGSGTVGVMEIAEAFTKAKAEGKGPRRSILFMAVSGEEKGLWGSEYFSENPTMPMEKVTANLNIDMIGRVDTERTKPDTLNYVYVVGDDKISTDLKPISESVNAKNLKMTLDYKFNDPNDTERIYFRSDHYNFARKGVPIIFYYDGMLKADYHKPTDTPDKINYPLLAKRARLVFHTAWEMTNREEMLKRDLPLPTLER
jgi:hypothetical protein